MIMVGKDKTYIVANEKQEPLSIGLICNTIVMDIPKQLGYTRFIN